MHRPFVSILMPIVNEAQFISKSLDAVLRQDYPASLLEVLIADGMSTDNTRPAVTQLSSQYPEISVKILDNPERIVPIGMNIALRQARGEIIIRVDGHCIIEPDYIRKCVDHIQNDGVDGVGGPMEAIGKSRLSKAIAIGMSSKFGVGDSAFRTATGKSMLVDTVPFPAYTSQIIKRVGLYDEELVRNQDDEYNYRIREKGGKLLLATDLRSTYFSRSSFQHLWNQYFQYGYWKVRVLQKHPRQMSLRQFIPPAFVLALILSILLVASSFIHLEFDLREIGGEPSLFLISAIVPSVYLAANLFSSIFTASKRGWQYLRLLPITFIILHASYGLGFLVGLVKFWDRWGDREGKVPQS